ncbi:MAG: formyltetrahydrofolate deformylase [Solirubrobacteraceae bacterium]
MTAVPATGRSASPDIGRLLVSCADRPGIVAAVSRFLYERGANIIESDQYSTDPEDGTFFLRTVFHLAHLAAARVELHRSFATEVAEPFRMEWQLTDAGVPKRVAIMVSRYDHCLLDLLWRARRGELELDIGLVISNHADLADQVRAFAVPFVHVPVTGETKAAAERRQIELLAGNFDLVVLARYMQVLSGAFLESVGVPMINIHHSFLPAFAGAGPYARASDKGVKLVGATAHYVTEELDDGPIIEQDVVRASHRDSAADLERRGADVERSVLSRAVGWHCEDRVIRVGNRTVVF